MRLLASLFGNLPQADHARFAESATESHTSDAFLEALQMSHGDLANLLRTALRAEYPGERTYVWTRDVYDDSVVYEVDANEQTRLYQRSYAITDGAVSFGDPMGVIAVTQYVKAEQAAITQVSQPAEESVSELTGDLVPLVEKSVKTDGTAKIKIIQPGQGSSGYYPADVLKRDAGVFREGTHVYLDHPSVSEESDRPERSVKDLAGSLTGPAVWEETGADGPGLYAPVKFIDSVGPHINAIASISGMSIRAAGKAGTREIDGKKVRTIESIDAAHSVDVVTRAGAGGKILDLIESARSGQRQPTEGNNDVKELEEAQGRIKTLEETIQDQGRELSALRRVNMVREAATMIEAHVANVITDATERAVIGELVYERLSGNLPEKDGALDREALTAAITEAAAKERERVGKLLGGNPVRGMGGEPPKTPETPKLEESQKRIDAALAAL